MRIMFYMLLAIACQFTALSQQGVDPKELEKELQEGDKKAGKKNTEKAKKEAKNEKPKKKKDAKKAPPKKISFSKKPYSEGVEPGYKYRLDFPELGKSIGGKKLPAGVAVYFPLKYKEGRKYPTIVFYDKQSGSSEGDPALIAKALNNKEDYIIVSLCYPDGVGTPNGDKTPANFHEQLLKKTLAAVPAISKTHMVLMTYDVGTKLIFKHYLSQKKLPAYIKQFQGLVLCQGVTTEKFVKSKGLSKIPIYLAYFKPDTKHESHYEGLPKAIKKAKLKVVQFMNPKLVTMDMGVMFDGAPLSLSKWVKETALKPVADKKVILAKQALAKKLYGYAYMIAIDLHKTLPEDDARQESLKKTVLLCEAQAEACLAKAMSAKKTSDKLRAMGYWSEHEGNSKALAANLDEIAAKQYKLLEKSKNPSSLRKYIKLWASYPKATLVPLKELNDFAVKELDLIKAKEGKAQMKLFKKFAAKWPDVPAGEDVNATVNALGKERWMHVVTKIEFKKQMKELQKLKKEFAGFAVEKEIEEKIKEVQSSK